MTKIADPFTRTPGVAGKAYIDSGIANEIINSFNDNDSSKYVYKITGLRGSGKSVEYGKVIRSLREKKDWLVYPLSSSGRMVSTLLSKISAEEFIISQKTTSSVSSTTSIAGNAVVVSGNESVNISKTVSENENYYSDEAALTRMIEEAGKKGYKVLVGIDDISKTSESVALLSMIGSMILEGLPIYLVVTGISENIEELSSDKSLSFFKRADTKETKALNKYDVTHMYEKLLGIDTTEARRIESLSMGYAYAYQVLGSLYFEKEKNAKLDDILPEFDHIMFRDSYDLIWKSLTKNEKELVTCICKTKNGKAEDIKALMGNPSVYPVYRERLINKHLIDGETRGHLKIRLPRFDKYIEIWGDEV